jgi:hypothetical protein
VNNSCVDRLLEIALLSQLFQNLSSVDVAFVSLRLGLLLEKMIDTRAYKALGFPSMYSWMNARFAGSTRDQGTSDQVCRAATASVVADSQTTLSLQLAISGNREGNHSAAAPNLPRAGSFSAIVFSHLAISDPQLVLRSQVGETTRAIFHPCVNRA